MDPGRVSRPDNTPIPFNTSNTILVVLFLEITPLINHVWIRKATTMIITITNPTIPTVTNANKANIVRINIVNPLWIFSSNNKLFILF